MQFLLTILVVSNSLYPISGSIEDERKVLMYDNFDDFQAFHNKSYDHNFDKERSRQAYEENCQRIRKHNVLYDQGNITFQLRANSLADLTHQNYLRTYVRLVVSPRNREQDGTAELVGLAAIRKIPADIQIPHEFDWRALGFYTVPKNQRACGACYAFSVAESIEGQIFKRTGKLISLSVQQLIDCSAWNGNKGCAGGSLRNALKYLERTGGIMRNHDYPYRAKEGSRCRYLPELTIVQVSSWAILPQNDEEAIRIAVAAIGPVAVSINASPETFQLYSKGIYDDAECTADVVNHAMLVVGYTPDYWILKNWWGRNWGEDGYMKVRRGRNRCGLANYAAYAVI